MLESSQSVLPLQHISDALRQEMTTTVAIAMVRLTIAAILGGVIGFEREWKHRPAGLRTYLFISVGAAMFTLLSDILATLHPGDHTRIAAQIIPGIGFIGAGSILRYRGDMVTGITSAATIFVVASIGMAVGGGLYLTATFATALILVCLFLLGQVEEQLSLKIAVHNYEVTGKDSDALRVEINRVLETIHAIVQNVHLAPTAQHVRLQFGVEGTRKAHETILHGLQQSPMFENVVSLGPVQTE